MKTYTVCLIIVLSSFYSSEAQTNIGDKCEGRSLCSKEAGLICGDDSTCVCTSGALTDSLDYSLQWNSNLKKCFGELGSACIGTIDNPVPVGAEKVECAAGLGCLQSSGLPIGAGSCQIVIPKTELTHGETCNSGTFCNKAAGLICGDDFKCTCTSGPLTHDINFTLEWNSARSKCYAILGSACVGTRQTPEVGGRTIECVEETSCEELEELLLPVGVGVCAKSEDPTTTGPGETEEPTTIKNPGETEEPTTVETPADTTEAMAAKSTTLNLLTIVTSITFCFLVVQ